MAETFISAGTDGLTVAMALADRLTRAEIAASVHDESALTDDHALFASIEGAERVAIVLTPGWAAQIWPSFERYLARVLRSPAAFVAKLALIDLSEGTAASAALRPLLGGGIRIAASQALVGSAMAEMMALAGPARVAPSTDGNLPRHVFVVGHPGSGKSTFCVLLEARLRERGVDATTMDPYPFLQTLFRIDQIRRDRTRFESDTLSEFLIRDPSVLDESVALTKARLSREAASGRTAIVELAFAEGPAVADIVSSRPDSIVVHVVASLDACKHNNEARGAIVRRHLVEEDEPSVAFDRLSSIHYVPPRLYARYDLDPRRWEEGAHGLATLAGRRYRRLENRGHDLSAYLGACDAFILATLWPLLELNR